MSNIIISGTGGLFPRIGALGGALTTINSFQGATGSGLIGNTNNIVTQYASGTQAQGLAANVGTALTAAQYGAEAFMATAQSIGQNTVNTMVYNAVPLSSNTNVSQSLNEVVTQLVSDSQSVLQMTVGTSVSYGTNTGNGVCVATSYRGDGLLAQNQFAETVMLSVSQDGVTNSSLAGSEYWLAAGEVAQSDNYSYTWPGGSGGSASLQSVNAQLDNSTGQLINNGGFEEWETNTPDNWTITVGSAGTQVLQGSTAYTGSYALEIVGDGSTLTALTQEFGESSGTSATLSPLSLYAVNFWVYLSAVPAAGALQVELTNGSTVINDEAGNPNSFTVTLSSGISALTWTNFSGVFRTSYSLPSTVYLQLSLSTALSSGKDLYVDQLGFAEMTQLYAGGPSLQIFSGPTDWLVGDTISVATTNGRGIGGTLATWQTLFQRLFSMNNITNQYGLPLQLPYAASGSQTLPDSWIM